MKSTDLFLFGNLQAIQAWSCPCSDRISCIGPERVNLVELYEARRHFHRDVDNSRKDKARILMEAHYQRDRQRFSRSFVIGNRGDCCAPSAGLTWGMSFNNWATARALLRANADYAPARREKRKVLEHLSSIVSKLSWCGLGVSVHMQLLAHLASQPMSLQDHNPPPLPYTPTCRQESQVHVLLWMPTSRTFAFKWRDQKVAVGDQACVLSRENLCSSAGTNM